MQYQFGPGPLKADYDPMIQKLKNLVGIVEDTDIAQHAIANGQYVVWKGDLYVAKADISSGTTLSSSNLTAKTKGVGEIITSLSSQIDTELQFPAKNQDRGRALLAMTDSGNNYMVFRLIQSADESSYYQIIFWGAQKKITIVKSVNGVETTVATFNGT